MTCPNDILITKVSGDNLSWDGNFVKKSITEDNMSNNKEAGDMKIETFRTDVETRLPVNGGGEPTSSRINLKYLNTCELLSWMLIGCVAIIKFKSQKMLNNVCYNLRFNPYYLNVPFNNLLPPFLI